MTGMAENQQKNVSRTKQALQKVLQFVVDLPRHLDWVLAVGERLLVLWILVVAFYFICRLVWRRDWTITSLLVDLASNWKVVLLLLLPLFYQTVRIFLEEVQDVWGMSRRPQKGRDVSEPQSVKPLRSKEEL